MNEMFKQAAARYPLKTDSSDWDAVAFKLLHTPVVPVPVKKKNKFNRYGLASLFILLLLVLADLPYQQKNSQSINARHASIKKAFVPGNDKLLPADGYRHAGSNHRSNDRPMPDTGDNIRERTTNTTLTKEPVDLTYDTEKTAAANKITSLEVASVHKPAVEKVKRRPAIYWGIVFGPALNRVKNQKLQKPGFDIGIMAGISLLKGNAFVETGLLYTQKYYYSEGRYFNMNKAGGAMPPGMEVMSLEGSSSLFELPVKFKYKVLEKQRSASFLSAGVSSYLMNREENNYDAMMNGTPESMVGSYNDKSRYIAVMANIGAEYNYAIGKHTFIRIEPYIQIPLKGIGIGSMPVMTTGLHIGLMRFTP